MSVRGLFFVVVVALAFLLADCVATVKVIHEGCETHKVIHEPQDINVKPWRERKRHPAPKMQ